MKLSSVLYSLLAPVALAAASSSTTVEDEGVRVLDNVQVDVVFPGSENAEVELVNGVDTAVELVVINNEKEPITVTAFSGSFAKEGKKGEESVANLTTTRLTPIEIKSKERAKIDHRLNVNLPPIDLKMGLQLIAMVNELPAVINVPQFEVVVNDPAISWFDPKLILAQLILAATIAVVGYTVTKLYVMPYLESPQKPGDKKKKSAEAAAPVAAPVEKNLNGKGYDESWIPEHHLRPTTGKKKKQ